MPTYSGAPSLSGRNLTLDYLLNQPAIVQRLMQDIAAERLIGGHLLTGRVDLTGSGAAVYEVDAPLMIDEDPSVVGELSEYPLVDDADPSPSLVVSAKRGFASLVSDEAVSRNRIDVFNRKTRRMVNRAVFHFDSIVLSAVASAVSQTQAAGAAWNAAGADQFLDLLLAGATIDENNEGYVANTVVAKPSQWARLVGSLAKTFTSAIDSSVIATGNIVQVAGLTLLKTTNLPAATEVIVLDNTQLGSIGFENLGGGYQGDASDPLGVETKVKHDDDRDGWKVQVRKTGVPMIQAPGAAVKVTGV